MATLHLSVVAPDRTIFEGPINSVIAPGVEGYFGLMSHHEPLIAALETGVVEYRDTNDLRSFISIGGGFLEVSGETVIILASSGELASEIDIREAETALEEARRALRGESSELTIREAQDQLHRSMTRIKAAQKVR